MNPHLQRGALLLEQNRHELAATEIRKGLAAQPRDGLAHALLALCLAQGNRLSEATDAAREAIHLAPDHAYPHFVHASILHRRNRLDEAVAAVEESIRLDPRAADSLALLSRIRLDQRRWPGALEAAERGLQVDPEHVGCANLRAIALVNLGRKDEAGAAIDATLAKAPDNSITHANRGWTLLHQGDHKKALDHFREALRLDPENEWARAGIVEALKARNIVYALLLKYFLWMARLSGRAQWFVIIGAYVGFRVLGSIARSNPELAPWIRPILVLYVAFAVLTWLAQPIFNLLLRLSRFGRLALSKEQIRASNWVGSVLLIAILSLAAWLLTGMKGPFLLTALVLGLLALPVAAIFKCPEGWPRQAMLAYTLALALVGLAPLLLVAVGVGTGNADLARALDAYGGTFLIVFFIGIFLSAFVANILMSRSVRK